MKKLAVVFILCATLAACESPEEKAQAHFESALSLLEEGDTVRARIELRNALQDAPTHLDASLELARLNVRENITRQAFTEYLRVAELDPTNLEAQVVLSQLAFKSANWDVFDRYSVRAIEANAEDLEVRIISNASAYRAAVLGEDIAGEQKAISEAEALQIEAPDSDLVRSVLLDGYLRAGDFEKALVQLDATIAADPEDIDNHNLKLRVLSNMRDADALEEQLRLMIELFPEDNTVRTNYVRYLLAQQKMDEAEGFLRSLIDEANDEADKNDALSTLIQFILQVDGPEAALTEVESTLQTSPDNVFAVTLKASLDFDMGRSEAAISQLEDVIAARTEATDVEQLLQAKVTLANMLSVTGNEVGARRLVEEVLEEDPRNVEALKIRAGFLIAEDATDEAITALRTALGESPQDTVAMALMAQAYERAGNTPLRLEFLSLAVDASNSAPTESLRYAEVLAQEGRLTQAETILIASLRVQPDNVEIMSGLGSIYLEMQDMSRLGDVIRALEGVETDQAAALANAFRLEQLRAQSGPNEVLSFLETLTNTESGDAARLAMIRTHVENNDNEAALRIATELVEENPADPTFRYFRALTLANAQDIEGAEAELRLILENAPQAEQVWLQLVRIQSRSGNEEAARATLEQALEASPTAPNLLWAQASYLEADGDVEGAIEIYEALYAENSSSIIVANNLASLLSTSRDDEESLNRAAIVARRLQGTEQPALQDTYGWILHRTGDSMAALEYLEPAAEALPSDPAVQFHLAEAYFALGRVEDAQAQIQRAVDSLSPIGTTDLGTEIRSRQQEYRNTGDN